MLNSITIEERYSQNTVPQSSLNLYGLVSLDLYNKIEST